MCDEHSRKKKIVVLGPKSTQNHFLLLLPPPLVHVRMACVRGEALCRTAPVGCAICPRDRYRTDRIWKRLFAYVTTPSVTTTIGSETIWSAGSGKPLLPSGRSNSEQPFSSSTLVTGPKILTQQGKINCPVLFQTKIIFFKYFYVN